MGWSSVAKRGAVAFLLKRFSLRQRFACLPVKKNKGGLKKKTAVIISPALAALRKSYLLLRAADQEYTSRYLFLASPSIQKHWPGGWLTICWMRYPPWQSDPSLTPLSRDRMVQVRTAFRSLLITARNYFSPYGIDILPGFKESAQLTHTPLTHGMHKITTQLYIKFPPQVPIGSFGIP